MMLLLHYSVIYSSVQRKLKTFLKIIYVGMFAEFIFLKKNCKIFKLFITLILEIKNNNGYTIR